MAVYEGLAAIRQRYLRDSLSVRLGGLATNLRRIKSFAANDASREVVESLIEESKYFIEWTAADAKQNTAELVELQIELARWQCGWKDIWSNPERRKQMAEQSSTWSNRVLEMSGLLNQQRR